MHAWTQFHDFMHVCKGMKNVRFENSAGGKTLNYANEYVIVLICKKSEQKNWNDQLPIAQPILYLNNSVPR